MYSDGRAAALYDTLNPWGPSDDFYLARAMAAPSVLDVGCGTGTMLRRARTAGHAGRLVGVDPDAAALDIARRQRDIEWVEVPAAAMVWDREFALATMMSHAFQFLVTDDEVRASLASIHHALIDGGHFVFETRNPAVRAWEQWNPDNPADVVDPAGRPVRITYEVEAVDGDVVTVTETTSDPAGTALRADRASLRFLGEDALTRFLDKAGFVVETRHGGWAGEPLGPTSPEIVTVARKA